MDAFAQLLAQSDLPCLVGRGKRYLQAGDPHRRERLKRELAAAWLSWRLEDYRDGSEILSLRRSPLRLVKRQSA